MLLFEFSGAEIPHLGNDMLCAKHEIIEIVTAAIYGKVCAYFLAILAHSVFNTLPAVAIFFRASLAHLI